MNKFQVTGTVKQFPGKYGWFYVELDESLSKDFRSIIKDRWPVLLGAEFRVNNTVWNSSIMPIQNGPLFIALPAKVRKAEHIKQGQEITVEFKPQI
jgi:hypothetical protein